MWCEKLRFCQPLLAGLLAAAVVGTATLGGPARAQSLEDALIQTYLSNPTLRAAQAELRTVNENVPQALAGFRPLVSSDASTGYGYTGVEQPVNSTSDRVPADAELSIIQSLYSGGQTVAAIARAENEVQAQRAFLKATEQLVLLQAVTAYLDVWRDQSIVELNKSNEAVLARQLEASRDRFEVGEITLTDVAQSESRLALATADRIAAQGNLSASQAVYERVVGSRPGELVQPAPVEGMAASLRELIELSIQDDPEVVAANFLERAARKSIVEAEAEFLPEVRLRGNLRYQHESGSANSESHSGEILAEVVVPLYQQGAVSSQVRAAKQFASQARFEIDVARLQAQEDAIQAWEGLQTARAQIESFEAAVRATSIALEGVRQENAVGARTVLDILDAEQEFLDAQVGQVGATRDELVARFAVLDAMGRLTARDIGLPVESYDPDLDYFKVRDKWFGTDAPGTE